LQTHLLLRWQVVPALPAQVQNLHVLAGAMTTTTANEMRRESQT
jgi:hypothetical protein